MTWVMKLEGSRNWVPPLLYQCKSKAMLFKVTFFLINSTLKEIRL